MMASPDVFMSHKRILVTDDDRRWREGLREVFEPRGYETLEAESGEQALELVHVERVHLLILDIELPHISGLETLRIIRQEIGDELPTIVVSSQVSDSVMAEALALKAFTVMSKMMGIHVLLRMVARVLEKYNSRE